MNLLILAIILGIISLGVLAYGFLYKPETKTGKPKDLRPKPDANEFKTLKLEEQVRSLTAELEKAKLDYQDVQNELALAKKKESDLQEELLRQKEWQAREGLESEKFKKESAKLKGDLINKEQELEKEFSLNINLNKELKEAKEKLGQLEKEKKDMTDEIRVLTAKITGYQKEIERQDKIILETKNKEEESEWISKKEYAALKKQLEGAQEAIKKLQGEEGAKGGESK